MNVHDIWIHVHIDIHGDLRVNWMLMMHIPHVLMMMSCSVHIVGRQTKSMMRIVLIRIHKPLRRHEVISMNRLGVLMMGSR